MTRGHDLYQSFVRRFSALAPGHPAAAALELEDEERLYKEAVEGRRRLLGPVHPDTLTSLNNLAMLYQEQGRYDEAERLHIEVLEGFRAALGPEHPDTLTSLNNLAMVYQAQGRLGEAEQVHKEVLERRRGVLGLAHPDTLASLHNLAAVYNVQGRLGEAERLYKEAVEGQRSVSPPIRPWAASPDIDPAEAQRVLDAIDEALRRPARPRTRGAPGVNAADQAVLEAARDLLRQVKEAGGGHRTHDAVATLELLNRVEEAGRR